MLAYILIVLCATVFAYILIVLCATVFATIDCKCWLYYVQLCLPIYWLYYVQPLTWVWVEKRCGSWDAQHTGGWLLLELTSTLSANNCACVCTYGCAFACALQLNATRSSKYAWLYAIHAVHVRGRYGWLLLESIARCLRKWWKHTSTLEHLYDCVRMRAALYTCSALTKLCQYCRTELCTRYGEATLSRTPFDAYCPSTHLNHLGDVSLHNLIVDVLYLNIDPV